MSKIYSRGTHETNSIWKDWLRGGIYLRPLHCHQWRPRGAQYPKIPWFIIMSPIKSCWIIHHDFPILGHTQIWSIVGDRYPLYPTISHYLPARVPMPGFTTINHPFSPKRFPTRPPSQTWASLPRYPHPGRPPMPGEKNHSRLTMASHGRFIMIVYDGLWQPGFPTVFLICSIWLGSIDFPVSEVCRRKNFEKSCHF